MGACCFTPKRTQFLWWYWLVLASIVGIPMLLAAWYIAQHTTNASPLTARIPTQPRPSRTSRSAVGNRLKMRLIRILFFPSIFLGIVLDCHGTSRMSPLYERGSIHEASHRGDLGAVQKLVATDGSLVGAMDKNGRTPLHWAVLGGHKELIKFLLAKKAEINARDSNDISPLHLVGVEKYESQEKQDLAMLLVKNGADVNAKDKEGNTPLHFAAAWGNSNVAEVFISNRAEVDPKNGLGMTPLDNAILIQNHLPDLEGHMRVREILVSHGAMEGIFSASAIGHIDRITSLLSANPELANATDVSRWSPLHWAAEKGRAEAISLLVKQGGDVNAMNKSGEAPLHRAAYGMHKKSVEALIVARADVNSRVGRGRTPIQCAGLYGAFDIVELLANNGADINIRNDETPLGRAIERGNKGMVVFLIQKGADVNAEHLYQTPLLIAAKKGDAEIVRNLIVKGAHVNVKHHLDGTPLNLALRNGHKDVVKILRENGALDETSYTNVVLITVAVFVALMSVALYFRYIIKHRDGNKGI